MILFYKKKYCYTLIISKSRIIYKVDLLVCLEDINHKIDKKKGYKLSLSWKFRNFPVKNEYFSHN